MSYRNPGNGYKASPNLETSVANVNILPAPPAEWTKGYQFYKFSFLNDQDCHVLINNDATSKFLRANQGFSSDGVDLPIESFKVVENGITYNWFGAY